MDSHLLVTIKVKAFKHKKVCVFVQKLIRANGARDFVAQWLDHLTEGTKPGNRFYKTRASVLPGFVKL